MLTIFVPLTGMFFSDISAGRSFWHHTNTSFASWMGPSYSETCGQRRYSGVTTTKPFCTRKSICFLGIISVDPRTKPPAWKMSAAGISQQYSGCILKLEKHTDRTRCLGLRVGEVDMCWDGTSRGVILPSEGRRGYLCCHCIKLSDSKSMV
jgi:hypothetical protein